MHLLVNELKIDKSITHAAFSIYLTETNDGRSRIHFGGYDAKIIALLREKLVLVKKEIDVRKTLKLELEAHNAGGELQENRLHYLAGKMLNEMTINRFKVDIDLLKIRIEKE